MALRLRGAAALVAGAAMVLGGCASHRGSGGARTASGSGGGSASAPKAATARIPSIPSGDWMQFDYNARRSGTGPSDTGITAGDLGALRRRTVRLPGTVDSSPVEVHAVRIGGRRRDAVIVTTSYGITVAFDPGTGRRLWRYVPRGTSSLEGGPQITTASPIIDPGRRYVYAASPNGFIHKLSISTGRQLWGTRITTNPGREKIEGALNISGRSVIAATGGYDGDAPPYQGHVVLINRTTGHLSHVWNSLCSNRRRLIGPTSSCPASDSAIWGRSGTVVEPGSGRILVTTGNGPFNGATNWGDSVLELSPTLHLLHNWTPTNERALNARDSDLGSTEPALLPGSGGLAVQGAKDGLLRLLDLNRLNGTAGGAGPRTGGELQDIHAPGSSDVFTTPAVWTHGGHVYVFVADFAGTAAYELGGNHRLFVAWHGGTAGTSPIVAGNLLYVFDPGGTLVIRNPVSGHVLATLPAASGHWNSPIAVGGRIILPVGNDNRHQTTGTVYVYHLPGR